MFFKKKAKSGGALAPGLAIPNHIAFIMDGNGRWAKKRGLPRMVGHEFGVKAFEKVLTRCNELGIKIVSIFAFSTENWNRPKAEVDGIINIIRKLINENKEKAEKQKPETGIRVRHMGGLKHVPPELAAQIEEITKITAGFQGMTINVCFNYGGRDDITNAVNRLIKSGKAEVTERDIAENLYSGGLPDPDIIVRTSGEKRMSNFMLWQMAYAELLFVDTYWPDMNGNSVDYAVQEFNKRERRFGAIKE